MTAATQPQPRADGQAAVVAVYQQQTAQVRLQLAAVVVALWRSLPDYRNASMVEFARRVVPVVNGAMGHMQAVTSGYLATLLSLSGGRLTPPAVRSLTVGDVRNGTDPADVYGRPFHLVWRELGAGKAFPDAVASGEARAVNLAQTDVQLAKTHTSVSVLKDERRVAGYRRVLEGPHSCGLCVVASTRLYHKAELMPMHPGCDCGTLPVVGDDPGPTVDPVTLEAAHAAIAERFGADSTAAREIRGALTDKGKPVLYRDVLIEHHHGEIGPVLGIRGQDFTGPSDIQ